MFCVKKIVLEDIYWTQSISTDPCARIDGFRGTHPKQFGPLPLSEFQANGR